MISISGDWFLKVFGYCLLFSLVIWSTLVSVFFNTKVSLFVLSFDLLTNAGKTTTASMLAYVLDAMGDDLTAVIGARVPQVGSLCIFMEFRLMCSLWVFQQGLQVDKLIFVHIRAFESYCGFFQTYFWCNFLLQLAERNIIFGTGCNFVLEVSNPFTPLFLYLVVCMS